MNFSSLSIRKKFKYMIIFSIFLVIVVGFLAEYISKLFVVPLFIYGVVVANYFASMKCSKCKQRIFYKYFSLFGVKVPICMAWVPEKCFHCGEPIH